MNTIIHLIIYLLIIISVPLIEVLFVNYIRRNIKEKHRFPVYLNNKSIELHYITNDGMMFGRLSKNRVLLIIVTIIGMLVATSISIYVWFYIEKHYFLKLVVALLTSGSLSNTLERFYFKYVVDYFSFPKCIIKKQRNIIFNLADIMIFLGSFILYIYIITWLIIK